MSKYFLLISVLLFQSLWAQHKNSELTAKYLKSEEAIREDEYANSLKRRDWLKNRLIFSAGAGSKYSVWGAGFPSFGGAVEYITPWHVGAFFSAGYVFPSTDNAHPSEPTKQGGSNWRAGLTYTFLPKLPLHPGISISYGKSYYDHLKDATLWEDYYTIKSDAPQEVRDAYETEYSIVGLPDPVLAQYYDIKQKPAQNAQGVAQKEHRDIIFTDGLQIELTMTYMTDKWYYFSLNVGASYSGKVGSSTNKSGIVDPTTGEITSLVIGDTDKGISEWNPVISAGVGFALRELFPDKTEIRRRQREDARNRLGL